jgi:hypothetical protein
MSTKINPMPLHEWACSKMEGKTAADYGYNSFWEQVMFVRDVLYPAVCRGSSSAIDRGQIVGTHMSKSIELPVYRLYTPFGRVTMRCNFYDWKVSVESSVGPLNADLNGLISREPIGHKPNETGIPSVYCEGFASDEVFEHFWLNPFKFTVEVVSKYHLFAMFWQLRRFAEKNEF